MQVYFDVLLLDKVGQGDGTSVYGNRALYGDQSGIDSGYQAMISAHCTRGAGVTIRSCAIVTAKTLGTRNVGSNQIIGGTPARLIRLRKPDTHA